MMMMMMMMMMYNNVMKPYANLQQGWIRKAIDLSIFNFVIITYRSNVLKL
jgi:hypothetical protein